MIRTVGTTVRGIRAPIVKEGDNISRHCCGFRIKSIRT